MTSTGAGGGIPMILLILAVWIPITLLAVVVTRKAASLWMRPAEFYKRDRAQASKEERDKLRASGKFLASFCMPFWGLLLMVWSFVVDRMAQGWVDLRAGPPVSGVALVGAEISFGIAVIGGVLAVLTFWFARPKILIPPYLRFDPSYAAVLKARSRGDNVDELYAKADERWRTQRDLRGPGAG